jgi:hypothetical protein
MNITKVEDGWSNDDFIHDRVTLLVHLADGERIAFKLYGDLRLKEFTDLRFSDGEYSEGDVSEDVRQAVMTAYADQKKP